MDVIPTITIGDPVRIKLIKHIHAGAHKQHVCYFQTKVPIMSLPILDDEKKQFVLDAALRCMRRLADSYGLVGGVAFIHTVPAFRYTLLWHDTISRMPLSLFVSSIMLVLNSLSYTYLNPLGELALPMLKAVCRQIEENVAVFPDETDFRTLNVTVSGYSMLRAWFKHLIPDVEVAVNWKLPDYNFEVDKFAHLLADFD